MKKLLISLSFILLCNILNLTAQNNAAFDKGVSFYQNNKFQQAIDVWKSIEASGLHSTSLYYNLGNAYYKLNKIGPSIYYYEKALLLSPNDADVLNNLAFAENAKIDAIEPLPQSIFKRWNNALSSLLTFDGWAKVSVVLVILFVLLFWGYYFSASEKKKRALFVTSFIVLLAGVISLFMAFKTFNAVANDRPAIIFAESVDVKDANTMGGETMFVLHEGTKVQILDETEDWYRIKLVNGKDGWIPKSEIKEL